MGNEQFLWQGSWKRHVIDMLFFLILAGGKETLVFCWGDRFWMIFALFSLKVLGEKTMILLAFWLGINFWILSYIGC